MDPLEQHWDQFKTVMNEAQKAKGGEYVPMVLVLLPAKADGQYVNVSLSGRGITMWPEHFPPEERAFLLEHIGKDLRKVHPENVEILKTEYYDEPA